MKLEYEKKAPKLLNEVYRLRISNNDWARSNYDVRKSKKKFLSNFAKAQEENEKEIGLLESLIADKRLENVELKSENANFINRNAKLETDNTFLEKRIKLLKSDSERCFKAYEKGCSKVKTLRKENNKEKKEFEKMKTAMGLTVAILLFVIFIIIIY